MFQIETKKLLGLIMLDNSGFFPFLSRFRSLVGMVLIDCNRFKSKTKFVLVGLKTLFCNVVFFTGPIVKQVYINSELLPCINKFK